MKSLGFYIKGDIINYACVEEKDDQLSIIDKNNCNIQRFGDSSKTMLWSEELFNFIIKTTKPDRISYIFSINVDRESQLSKIRMQGVLELICCKMDIPVLSKNKQSFTKKDSAFWKRIFWKDKAMYDIIVDKKFGKLKTPWNMDIKLALACAWETLIK